MASVDEAEANFKGLHTPKVQQAHMCQNHMKGFLVWTRYPGLRASSRAWRVRKAAWLTSKALFHP